MEELRTTEILDKEIEADARKKAEKILAKAEEECARVLAEVSDRVNEASRQKEEYYKEKLAHFEKNVEAALPLEKERFLISFYADSVSKAFNAYLKELGEEKRLGLISKRIEKISQVLLEKKINASVFGFEKSAAEKMLKSSAVKNLASVADTSFEKSGEEACDGNDFHEGIILEAEDKSFRVRLTVDQLVREIKDQYSNELATTLFGGRLPE
ncbi:MAG: hypothetical protein KBT11_10155 [Treponema sp.]|nr:hypothetical protein [Candidatus Treponema equifaecale]